MKTTSSRLAQTAAFIVAAYAASMADPTNSRMEAAPYVGRAAKAAAVDSLLFVLLLGVIHCVVLILFARRWHGITFGRRVLSSGFAGAGSYLLLLLATSAFRTLYADPLQATWILIVLLALPAVVATVVFGEAFRHRSRKVPSAGESP